MRADAASGVVVPRAHEQVVDELAARRVSLEDERRRLDARLGSPPTTVGPHDHLNHRHLPMPEGSPSRRRLLAIWSALSTPLILVVVANAFLPGATLSIRALLLFGVLVLLTIEAVARRQLLRFVGAVVLLVVVVSVVSSIAALVVFRGWQTTVAVVCVILAAVLLISNLRELARD